MIASDVDTGLTGIIAIDPVHSDTLYLSGLSRIARSVDGGSSWQNLTPQDDVRGHTAAALVDPTRRERVLIGSSGSGVREISIQPDLSITALEYPVTVPEGSQATYRYRIQNLGPFDATGVQTTVQLSSGSSNIAAQTSDGTCTVSGTTATCRAAVLRVSELFEITVGATVAQSANASATVQSDQPDPVSSNNSFNSAVGVGQSDMSITISGPTGGATSAPCDTHTIRPHHNECGSKYGNGHPS